MDYLIVVKFGNQAPDNVDNVKNEIIAYGGDNRYCEVILQNGIPIGIVHIVRFEETATDAYFLNFKDLVARINKLPQKKYRPGASIKSQFEDADLPKGPATWGQASMQDVVDGFKWVGPYDINSGKNPYMITGVKGGTGGRP